MRGGGHNPLGPMHTGGGAAPRADAHRRGCNPLTTVPILPLTLVGQQHTFIQEVAHKPTKPRTIINTLTII
jgi:hypothetical protein